MSDTVAFLSVTLDGVMQGPGHPDEDRRGGFDRGGWGAPYADEITVGLASEGSGSPGGGLLFGRHTFEHFQAVWAGRTDNPFSPMKDNATKYVASRSLQEPLSWVNSILLKGEAAETVARLRAEGSGDLVILGSGELVRSLLAADLLDRMIVLIHPLVLGAGQRLFDERGDIRRFRLTETKPNTKGVIIARYERDRDPA